MATAPRDPNRVPALLGTSDSDGSTPIPVWVDPDTHELEVKATILEKEPTDPTKVNASLTISNADEVEASTKTLTKTIDGVSYTKTLSYNAGGDVIAISAWSEV